MKCHLVLFFSLISFLSSVTSQEPEDLVAEHRSAKPEPFLDRLAAFFSGAGQNDKKYQPPPPPPFQQTSASVQRPVAVKPPLPPRPPNLPKLPQPPPAPIRKSGPARPNPVYQGQSVAPSNNFATFVKPGKKMTFFDNF